MCFCFGGSAFERWQENTVEKRTMVAKSAKVLMRWKLQSVARCLDTWRELAHEELRKRQVMFKIVQRMRHKSLSAAIDVFCANVKDFKTQHGEEERMTAKVVARCKMQASCMCVDAWHMFTEEEARKRALMKLIVARMTSKCVCFAFERLCESVEHMKHALAEEQRKQKRVQHFLKRMLHVTESAGIIHAYM